MRCDAKTWRISTTEVYIEEWEPDEIIISVPENNLGVFHHAYQENFYNGEKMFENLLQR